MLTERQRLRLGHIVENAELAADHPDRARYSAAHDELETRFGGRVLAV